jgi:hypothetical protein
MVAVTPLGVVPLGALWGGFTAHHWALNRVGIGYAVFLGAFFFLLAFVTAAIDDIQRNWIASELESSTDVAELSLSQHIVLLGRSLPCLSPRRVAECSISRPCNFLGHYCEEVFWKVLQTVIF